MRFGGVYGVGGAVGSRACRAEGGTDAQHYYYSCRAPAGCRPPTLPCGTATPQSRHTRECGWVPPPSHGCQEQSYSQPTAVVSHTAQQVHHYRGLKRAQDESTILLIYEQNTGQKHRGNSDPTYEVNINPEKPRCTFLVPMILFRPVYSSTCLQLLPMVYTSNDQLDLCDSAVDD